MKIIRGELDAMEFWHSISTEDSPAYPVLWVDLNGVLDGDEYPGWEGEVRDYPPAKDAEWFLRNARNKFNTVGVLTATQPIQFASDWLVAHGLDQYVDYVTNIKLPGIYLDDKAVTHWGDLRETLTRCEQHIPHWQGGTDPQAEVYKIIYNLSRTRDWWLDHYDHPTGDRCIECGGRYEPHPVTKYMIVHHKPDCKIGHLLSLLGLYNWELSDCQTCSGTGWVDRVYNWLEPIPGQHDADGISILRHVERVEKEPCPDCML